MESTDRLARLTRRLTVEETEELLDETIDSEILNLYEQPDMQEHVHIVRKHWNDMEERDQFKVCVAMLVKLLRTHAHLRPYFAFARGSAAFARTDDGTAEPVYAFEKADTFRSHVKKMHAVLKVFIESMFQPHRTIRLMCELGERHFFYDAAEAHIQLIGSPLLEALREYSDDDWTDRLELAWSQSFTMLVVAFTKGICVQRQKYLQHCITHDDIAQIREHWSRINTHGLAAAGQALCGSAIIAYEGMCKQNELTGFALPIHTSSDDFAQFAEDTVKALGSVIEAYDEHGGGFGAAPLVCQPYCKQHTMANVGTMVCPSMLRKAVLEGVQHMLVYVIGESSTNDHVLSLWNKMYRVFEQAIIINVMYQ